MFLFIVLGLKFGIFVLMPWWFGAGDMSHYDDLGIWERVGMAAGDVFRGYGIIFQNIKSWMGF
ncbi:hypothetical protein [Ponticaulis sp.]|uniref:hypothetical protein n=1 Tax=Ponticaulis sp. TaxID=2020902 RepID=UPI0025E0B62A|nr:hypothetical protein [Ponticaulis sp.]